MNSARADTMDRFTWDQCDAEERLALVSLVSDTLTAMLRDPASWLPGAVESTPRGFVLTIEWDMERVDASIVRMRTEAVEAERTMLHELRRMSGLADDDT